MAEQTAAPDEVAQAAPAPLPPPVVRPEVAPPAPAAKVRMLGPNNVVYDVDGGQAKLYEQHGYTRYEGPTIDEGSIEAKFGAWKRGLRGAPTAAAVGAVNQVPLLDYGLEKVAPDAARSLAEATAEAKADHPLAYGAGSLGGAVAAQVAGGAAFKAGGAALGLLGKGTALTRAAQASPVIASMVEGALGNAALNAADQLDAAALDHALSPEGQEKVSFSILENLGAAFIGGAIPGATGGLTANAGRGARGVERWSRRTVTDAFVSPEAQQALRDQGRGDVLNRVLWPTIEKGGGSDEVARELGNKVKSLLTTKDELLVSTRDHPMTVAELRETLDKARSHVTDSRLVEDDLRPLSRALDSHDAHEAAQVALGQARGGLATAQASGNARLIRKAQRGVDRATRDAEVAEAGRQPLPKDIDLQQVHEKLYQRANHQDMTGNPAYEQYVRAGREVSRGRDMIFERMGRPGEAPAWRQNKKDLSDHLAVVESLNKKHLPNVKEAMGKATNSAAMAGAMASLGLGGAGVMGAAAKGGFMAGLYYGSVRHIAVGSRRLSGWLVNADQRLAGAIKLGLLGTAAPRAALHELDYQGMAAQVLAAQRDPATSYANIQDAALAKGVPEAVADKVTPRIHAVIQQAAMTVPKPTNTPDIATAAQPDLHQQRAWLSETRSRMDPSYALMYPTRQNMAAAKQHHPETVMRAQEAVMEALHKNPYLPIASRMWAARVLGRPAGTLTSPKFYQSLAQMRAKADAEAQSGAGGPAKQRGASPQGAVQSEQSRLDELSNRQ